MFIILNNMSNLRVIKVKDWLKFRHPDHQGFNEHIEVWKKAGIKFELKDLVDLAIAYNIKPPSMETLESFFSYK